jgi:hypothetical protein
LHGGGGYGPSITTAFRFLDRAAATFTPTQYGSFRKIRFEKVKMAGRPRKPTNLLKLTGYFEKHPERLAARESAPVPAGELGEPPAHFNVKKGAEGCDQAAELAGIWREVAEMAPWLTSGDRYTVEDICELRWRARHRVITPSERNTLKQLSSTCGLDSVGRARLGTTIPAAERKEPMIDPRDEYERRTRRPLT